MRQVKCIVYTLYFPHFNWMCFNWNLFNGLCAIVWSMTCNVKTCLCFYKKKLDITIEMNNLDTKSRFYGSVLHPFHVFISETLRTAETKPKTLVLKWSFKVINSTAHPNSKRVLKIAFLKREMFCTTSFFK